MKRKFVILLAAVATLAAGCAKENSSPKHETSRKYFEAWIRTNYPDAIKTSLGAYILSDTPGSGELLQSEKPYAFVNFTVSDLLSGEVSNTTYEDVAQRVFSSYTPRDYYGHKVWLYQRGTLLIGLYEGMEGMKVGGRRKIAVPGWLAVYNDYSDPLKYLEASDIGSSSIFDVKLEGVTDDVIKWEIDTLERFVKVHMQGVDSTMYGYYYIQTKQPTSSSKFKKDTTFTINYIGRHLDGRVFDTNIADTAKFYGIDPNMTGTYGPQYVSMAEEYTDITMGSTSSSGSNVVDGFAFCLSELSPGEAGTCVFYSALGYGVDGNGSAIPAYVPIRFDIQVVDEE